MENAATEKTQVVIVGAGPTGLSMAAQLLRYDIDFIVIEKNEKTTILSKAIAVQARSLEIFDELGIAAEAIAQGQVTTGMNLFYKGELRAGINLSGLGKGLSAFPFALSLEQSKTEKLLADHVMHSGKTVQWNSTLTGFEQDENKVTVLYKDDKGIDKKIEADYLVGCDGAGSLVRHTLNFSFEGSTEAKLFYVADVLLNSDVINKNVLYMYMIQKGFVLFFPMEGAGHYRIVGILPGAEKDAAYEFSDIETTIKQQIVTPVTFTELRWFSTYKVHSRKADAFMRHRCFIAGDAAHIHTPAGGQGMNTGIQDAYNLAWKIACVLKDELKNEVLKTYDTERSENAKHLLQTTDRMFDIMSGVNRFWNVVRLSFLPLFFKMLSTNRFVQKNIFPLLGQTGIAYPNSGLTQKSSVGKLKAGDRMHYFVFANGRDIFSYLKDPAFKLLYFGKNAVPNPFYNSGITMSFHSFTEVPESIFGNNREIYILLRPDNHISYVGKDVEDCRELIDKIKR